MPSLTKQAVGRRKYTPEQTDHLFAVLGRGGSVSRAARDLGFNQVTCSKWVSKAELYLGEHGIGMAKVGARDHAQLVTYAYQAGLT